MGNQIIGNLTTHNVYEKFTKKSLKGPGLGKDDILSFSSSSKYFFHHPVCISGTYLFLAYINISCFRNIVADLIKLGKTSNHADLIPSLKKERI